MLKTLHQCKYFTKRLMANYIILLEGLSRSGSICEVKNSDDFSGTDPSLGFNFPPQIQMENCFPVGAFSTVNLQYYILDLQLT